jgi:hypothetical protein
MRRHFEAGHATGDVYAINGNRGLDRTLPKNDRNSSRCHCSPLRRVVVVIHSHPLDTRRQRVHLTHARPSLNSQTVSSSRHWTVCAIVPITFPTYPPAAEPKERNFDQGRRHDERKAEDAENGEDQTHKLCIHDRASMTSSAFRNTRAPNTRDPRSSALRSNSE